MSKLSYSLAMLSLSGLAGAASEAAATTSTTVMLDITSPDPSTITSSVSFIDLTPITLAGAANPQFYFGFEYAPGASNSTGNGSVYEAEGGLFTAEVVSETPQFGTDNNNDTITNPYAGSLYEPSAIAKPGSLTGELPSPSEVFKNPGGITSVYENPGIGTIDSNTVDLTNMNVLAYKINYSYDQYDFYKHAEFTSGSQEYLATFHVDADGGIPEVTYAAVPEPEAWALLIAGAAMTGGAARSRRRKAPAAAASL